MRLRRHPVLRAAGLALILGGGAGCTAPSEALVPPTDAARAAPPPQLAETALFRANAARAAYAADRVGTGAAALAARARALQARASTLQAPVLDPATRRKLGGEVGARE